MGTCAQYRPGLAAMGTGGWMTGQTEQARKGKFEQGFESKRGMYCAERMVGGVDSVYFLFF